jgi:hypothetical protein
MTNLCTIGPVTITDANLYDGNTFNYTNSTTRTVTSGSSITTRGQFDEEYGFDIICTNSQFIQLQGVVEMGEIIWMDSSSELTDNNYLQHKGWVVLTELTSELLNPNMVQCSIKYIKISAHENEYLTMDYSRGIYDGISLNPSYTIANTSYLLQEDGSDATTNWSTIRKYSSPTTASFVSDGTEFDMTCYPNTDGSWGRAWVICDTKRFTPPFTFETVLDRNSLPGAGSFPAAFGIMFSPNDVQSLSSEIVDKNLGDYLELQWNVSNTNTSLQLSYLASGGSYQNRFSGLDMGTVNAELGIRMNFTADKKVSVYTDNGVTGTWTLVYSGTTGLVNSNDLILYLYNMNKDSTSYTGSFQYANITQSNQDTFPNIVTMPYNSTQVTPPTGHRHGEDGDIYYYTNPTNELRYTINKADYYKGSVKLLSTNNISLTSTQVYSTEYKLTPTTTILKNEFTRLTFDNTAMYVEGYISGSWQLLNKFVYPTTINLIRPIFINSERIVLQINDTKITMLRSSPMITLEHPNTTLTYTLHDRYDRTSGFIASPGANADIPMTLDSDYWCTVYNIAAPTNQLLIGKKDKCTIKSDSLPADTMTALGWFRNGDLGIDLPTSKIQEWYKQTRTGISLKEVI